MQAGVEHYFRLELQRIKFMVNSYMRIRLEKIQDNIFYYSTQHPDNPSRLTSQVNIIDYSNNIKYESGALVPRAFPSKRQFVSERLNAFKLFTHRQTKRDYRLIIKIFGKVSEISHFSFNFIISI